MRKIVVLLLAVCILAGSFNAAYASGVSLNDIEKHWAKDSIEWLVSNRLVTGYPDSSFKPNNPVSVIEFVKLAVLGAGYKLEGGAKIWYENYLNKALEIGLLADGEYPKLNAAVTREQMAKLISLTAANIEEVPDSTLDELVRINIRDFAKIGDEYKQHVIDAYKIGLLAGNPDGFFNPRGTLTRAEACTIIQRLMDKSKRLPFKPENGYGIILNNIYSGDRYVIARPERKEEIQLAYLLNSDEVKKKSKGWYFVSYNPDQIGLAFFDSKEKFEEGLRSPLGILPEATNGAFSMDLSSYIQYYGVIYQCDKVRSMDREVFIEAFKFIFKNDSQKAIDMFEKYLQYVIDGDTTEMVDNLVIDGRKMEFTKLEGYSSFHFKVFRN